MFNAIKKMFTGGAQAPQQQAAAEIPRTFSKAEFDAISHAHKALYMQLHMSQAGKPGDTSCKLHRPEQVTPWVMGYLSGILDFTTQCVEGKQQADLDVLQVFWQAHIDDAVMKNAIAAFATSQDAMRTGKDLFGHGEQYAAGAKAGFNCLPRNENDAPRLELMHYLRNIQ